MVDQREQEVLARRRPTKEDRQEVSRERDADETLKAPQNGTSAELARAAVEAPR